jgi:lipid II:glycine glycyltransferase (peptidoglycan interpeptide bridge formation enzyme)
MHIALHEPSPAAWDAFVNTHPQGHLLQSTPWGNLKTAFGWSAWRIAVVRSSEPSSSAPTKPGPLLAGAQVLFRERYGVSIAYIPRGPLLAGDPAIDMPLMQALERTARRRRAVLLRLEPNVLEREPQAAAWHALLDKQNCQVANTIQPRTSIHLDLTPEPEQLFARLSKGHRADIRRAEREGVQVRSGTRQDIATFYAILRDTSQRAAFGIHPEAYYRLAWDLFRPASNLLLAEQNGQPIAAHIVFAGQQMGYYFYGGATAQGLRVGANHLLQWHAIQWARHQGCHRYDLWGIPDALGRAAATANDAQREALLAEAHSDPMMGVYRFKKGFGGEIVRYMSAFDRVFVPPLYGLWRRRLE